MTISRRSFLHKLAALTKGLAVLGIPRTLHAKTIQPRMIDPLIGSISLFAYNFIPLDWAACNGQSLNISQYQTLHSLIGTKFGGNGTTTFNLPNLVGVAPSQSANPPTNTQFNINFPLYCINTSGSYPSFSNGTTIPTARPNTATPTKTPTNTATKTATYTATKTPTNTATTTSSPTNTYTPTNTATTTSSPTNTYTPTNTATTTPSLTNTYTPTATSSPTATATFTPTSTTTPTFTATATPTTTTTQTATLTATATKTDTPTATSSITVTTTASSTPTATASSTSTATKSITATRSATTTMTNTPTLTKTFTQTRTNTRTTTITNSRTNTRTATATLTNSPTRTTTNTPTPTNTKTTTNTRTNTRTQTPTLTKTSTRTLTRTQTPSATMTPAWIMGWNISSTNAISVWNQTDQYAQIGKVNNEITTIQKTITISSANNLLTGKYRFLSTEPDATLSEDIAQIIITVDGIDQVLQEDTLYQDLQTATWSPFSYNLSAFQNKSVTVKFRISTDASYVSSMLIKDVLLGA